MSRPLQLESLEDRSLLTSYLLTEIGTLPGGNGSTPNDINAAGQVVGTADTPHNSRAFLWNNGTIIDLGTLQLDGYNAGSEASAINDLGQIVGWSGVSVDGLFATHAFLITPEDTDGDSAPDRWFRDLDADGVNDLMIDLGLPAGSPYSLGVDINNAGQIVVHGSDLANYTAFLWDHGTFTQLDVLADASGGASRINAAGQVVGSVNDDVGFSHPFVWDGSRGATDLGTTDFPYGGAAGINTSGSVVGVGVASDNATRIAFLWTPDQPNGTVGVMTALEPLPYESYSSPEDINDAGLVVGTSTFVTTYCEDDGFGEVCWDYYGNSAVLWENGAATVLQDHVVGQSVTLTTANAINAAGQIVGSGSEGGYLLTPTGGPIISVGDAILNEGDSGTQSANFTISLDAPSDQLVTVTWTTANGTASAGTDFVAASGTLNFLPGETSKDVPVLVNGDTLYEPYEFFFLNIISATNVIVADGSGAGNIFNDDPIPPSVVISNASVTEGDTGTVIATFTVTLSAASSQPVTVHYETASGSATAGSDFTAASGEVTIAAGHTNLTIPISVFGDGTAEPNEFFVVNLSAATNGLIADGQGVGTIVDDEPRIGITDVSKSEGKKGHTTLFTFTITLSAPCDQTVTMSFRTANGTATSGSDYIARTGTLTFAPGETTKTITIEIKGDSKREASETFYLDLFGLSSNATFTKNRGLGTILNDD